MNGLPGYILVAWMSFTPSQHQPPGNLQGFILDITGPCLDIERLVIPVPSARWYVLDIGEDIRTCANAVNHAEAHVAVSAYTDKPGFDLDSSLGNPNISWTTTVTLIWGSDVNTSHSVGADDFLKFASCYGGSAVSGCVPSDLNRSQTVDALDFLLYSAWHNYALNGGPLPAPYCETAAECEP